MRVASLNLLSGMTPGEDQFDLGRLRAAVASLDADVLGIQEVDRFQPTTANAEEAAEVADAVGAVDYRYVAALSGIPSRAWTPAGGEVPAGPSYGIALMSRRPVRAWHVLRLSALPVYVPLPVPGTRRVLWLKDQPRLAIAAELDGVTVATTHLSFVAGWNVVQLRRVRRWLQELPGPHVLMGDLNLPRSVAVHATGWTSLVSGRTFPSWNPKVQLDHVLTSGGLVAAEAAVRVMPVSDHCAVSVDLRGESLSTTPVPEELR
jgi:endonuclease/exonuclease/phosphatase family metal-dependent hydrolase